jgi:hypothetical protein
MDPIIEQALNGLGLQIVSPEEIAKTFQFADCRQCFQLVAVNLTEPLWLPQLMAIENHVNDHMLG